MSRSNAVLFVCSGNICCSSRASFATRSSASAKALQLGSTLPAELAIEIAAAYGVDISAARLRRIGPGDFARYGRIMVIDHGRLDLLAHPRPASYAGVIALMTADGGEAFEVPDPYGGGRRDYEKVGRLIALGVRSLTTDLSPEAVLDWDGN